MKNRLFKMLSLLLLIFYTSLMAKEDFILKKIATLDTSYYDIELKDHYAFVATNNGLKILDISNPKSIKPVGFIDSNATAAYDIVLKGDYAYLANASNLKIIDIKDPSSPKLVGIFENSAKSLISVAVDSNYAYVGDFDKGLYIVDIQDPQNPKEIANIPTGGNVKKVKVYGNKVFIADGLDGIKIFDTTIKDNPKLIGKYKELSNITDIIIDKNILYAADETEGIDVLNVSDPKNIIKISHFNMENFGDSIYSIKKYDDKIFAAASLSGLHVIDISNPKNLKEITSYDTKDYTLNVAADKNRAFVASDYGLEVIDINNTDKPKEIGNFETSGESWSIKVKDNYAYVIGWKYGLKVVDISDVNFPKIVGHLKTDFATDILIDKNYAYITNDYAGVSIIDIKDPKNPTLISSVKTPAAWGITKHNDKLLINDLEKGLLIIDIKNKENPQIIASLPLQEKKRFKIRYLLSPSYNMDDFRRDIKIKDNLAFMANGSRGVEIIDISDIINPKFVSNIPTLGTAVALSISKNILYIAEKEEGVETADITNPLSAKIINKIKTNGKAMDLAFYDSIMLVADANMGLTSFSISALSDLAKEESKDFVIGYNTLGISVVNDKIFITDENSGLQIFKIIDENKQALIKKFVNYIYQNIMDREPDANGLDYWSNEFYKGVIPTQNAIKFFFQSDEFQSKQLNNDEFITILYKTIFQRKPDLEGKQFWLSKLNEDIKREDIIDQFLKSKEFTKLIKSFGID